MKRNYMRFFVEILLAEGLLKIDATILVNVTLPSALLVLSKNRA